MTMTCEEPAFTICLNEEEENPVKKVVSDLVSYAKSLVVSTESEYKSMTSLYRQARDWRRVIEARRKELTEPLRNELARINDKAKEVTEPLDEVIELANAKTGKYLLLLEDLKKKREADLNAIASLFGCDEPFEIEPVKNIIRGEGAMMIKKSEKRFRLLDIAKVPIKYLMINEEAIKRDLKLGVETIPGIEVYNETTTQLRTR